jgi:hypothetical protein
VYVRDGEESLTGMVGEETIVMVGLFVLFTPSTRRVSGYVPGDKSGNLNTMNDPLIVEFGPTASTLYVVPLSCTDRLLTFGVSWSNRRSVEKKTMRVL